MFVYNLLMGTKQSKITYFDGSYYEGEVNAAGKEHGLGRITYANGDSLKGNFVDEDCVSAIITYKNGDIYEGQMKNHKYHGKGKLVNDRSTQIGLFRQSRFIHGKIEFKDGTIYEGSIENGCKTGKGLYKTIEGNTYNGYFKKDMFDGSGVLKSKDGSSYQGQFNSGVKSGKGILISYNQNKKAYTYEGMFKSDKFDGKGKLIIQRPSKKDEYYEGEFKEGKKHGQGKYYYENGDIYQGLFNEDMRTDPSCHIIFNSGTVYKGGILNGKYQNFGCLKKNQNQYYEGKFKNSLKNGQGELRTTEFVFKGTFVDDKKQGAGVIQFLDQNGEQTQTFEGNFKNDKKDGLGILKGKTQYLKANYIDGIKNGQYVRKLFDQKGVQFYRQQGTYKDDKREGYIKIKKSQFEDTCYFQNDQKADPPKQ